jgi:hypothetical protein
MIKTLIIAVIILLALTTTNTSANELINSNKISTKQVSFIQNNSQWNENILYLSELPGLNI